MHFFFFQKCLVYLLILHKASHACTLSACGTVEQNTARKTEDDSMEGNLIKVADTEPQLLISLLSPSLG